MTVNVNNLRRQAVRSYERLVRTLNQNLKDAEKYEGIKGQFYSLDASEIQEDMDDIRMYLGTFAAIYMEGDEHFKDMSEEIGTIEEFNPEPEDE